MRLNRTLIALAAVAATSGLAAGCGNANLGRSPSQVSVTVLEAASGAKPDDFANTMLSDVETLVKRTIDGQQVRVPTVFDDFGRVTLTAFLRDPGPAGNPTSPSSVNNVTFTRYRVVYRRADGRNTPGLDVPYAFDSGMTFTVPAGGSASGSFEIVRHLAKEEAPLKALVNNGQMIATIADVSFYGKDQSGNDVTVTGSIGINFGNFGDPD